MKAFTCRSVTSVTLNHITTNIKNTNQSQISNIASTQKYYRFQMWTILTRYTLHTVLTVKALSGIFYIEVPS